QGVVASILEFLGVALEDDDVLRPHAGTLEPLDAGDHDFPVGDAADRAGDAARFARLRGSPDRVDLDAHHVARLAEALPGPLRVFQVAIHEGDQAAVDHRADDGRVGGMVGPDGTGVMDLNDAAGIASRHRQLGALDLARAAAEGRAGELVPEVLTGIAPPARAEPRQRGARRQTPPPPPERSPAA